MNLASTKQHGSPPELPQELILQATSPILPNITRALALDTLLLNHEPYPFSPVRPSARPRVSQIFRDWPLEVTSDSSPTSTAGSEPQAEVESQGENPSLPLEEEPPMWDLDDPESDGADGPLNDAPLDATTTVSNPTLSPLTELQMMLVQEQSSSEATPTDDPPNMSEGERLDEEQEVTAPVPLTTEESRRTTTSRITTTNPTFRLTNPRNHPALSNGSVRRSRTDARTSSNWHGRTTISPSRHTRF
jgi:hypothetical protein